MTNLIPLVFNLAPELGPWLFNADTETTAKTVTKVVQAASGASDPDAVAVALQQNPAAAIQIRAALGRAAADWQQNEKSADLAQLAKLLQTTLGSVKDQPPASGQAWAAPAISAGVLAVFTLMMTFIMVRGMPAGAETAVNLLLGTLAAMATSVVSYWVGSSAGSARKDDRLAQLSK